MSSEQHYDTIIIGSGIGGLTCASYLAQQQGKKVLIAGNGGSAADAQHIAAELVGRFQMNRGAFPAIALTTDTSILTAVGNDFGFDQIFVRQVEALKNPGDIFIGISTSGNSRNLIKTVELCRDESIKSIGFLGNGGGELGRLVDLPIVVNSMNTARIQEAHITISHILCELVENSIYGDKDQNP